MGQARADRRHRLELAIYLVVAVLVFELVWWRVLTLAAGSADAPAWAQPSAMAVKQVSTVAGHQSEPNLFNNLDCTMTTYRVPASSNMQTGCFTEAAFGLFDSDSSTAIYTGSDEGLPLLGFSAQDVLAPWPRAEDLLVLNAVNTGGSTLRMYLDPLAHAQDVRNLFGQLTAKQLVSAPDFTVADKLGQPLVINPQTIAFSDNGSWLVAETLNSSFVRINLATLDIKAFAPSFGSQGSPGLLQSRVAISQDGHYAAIMNSAAQVFKVYDLTACAGGGPNLQPENCPSFDYLPFIKSRVAGLNTIRHIRFVNDGLVSFEVNSFNSADSGIYELAPAAGIDSLIDYLGMGDSFTSGEGAFDYLAGTDTADNVCHLSARSYPLLLTHDLFSARGGHSAACSGAVIHDVASQAQDYRGQIRGGQTFEHLQASDLPLLNSVMANFLPGYVAQQKFVQQYQPAITTVSIGGNDIGFGDILEQCVLPKLTRHTGDNACFNTYEDRQEVVSLIDRTGPRWTRLYNQLKAEAPGTRLYAIGYPSIFSDQGNCGLNVQLGKNELEFAEELVVYLNSAIRTAAGHAGAVYVDISHALDGHRLCEANTASAAVNGLTAGNSAGIFGIKVLGSESYHPNALGQQLIEQAILKQTHNLTEEPSVPAPDGDAGGLLKGTKTGRAVNVRVPSSNMTSKTIKKGRSASVKTAGQTTGIKPNTPVKIHLDGPGGPVIGGGSSDENGDTDIPVAVPGGTETGGHTIDLTGSNQAGDTVDVVQPVFVPDSDSDADGDGVPDTSDSCPMAVNSGVDADSDGVDDICDGYIGPASDGPPGTTDTTGSLSVSVSAGGSKAGSAGSGPSAPSTAKSAASGAGKAAPSAPNAPRSSGALKPLLRRHGGKIVINWAGFSLLLILLWLMILLAGLWYYREQKTYKHYAYA